MNHLHRYPHLHDMAIGIAHAQDKNALSATQKLKMYGYNLPEAAAPHSATVIKLASDAFHQAPAMHRSATLPPIADSDSPAIMLNRDQVENFNNQGKELINFIKYMFTPTRQQSAEVLHKDSTLSKFYGGNHQDILTPEAIDLVIAAYITLRFEIGSNEVETSEDLKDEIAQPEIFKANLMLFLGKYCNLPLRKLEHYDFSQIKYFGGLNIKLSHGVLHLPDFNHKLMQNDKSRIKNHELRQIFSTNQFKLLKAQSLEYFAKIQHKIANIQDHKKRRVLITQLIYLLSTLNIYQRKICKEELSYSEIHKLCQSLFKELNILSEQEQTEFINYCTFKVYHQNYGAAAKKLIFPTLIVVATGLILPVGAAISTVAGSLNFSNVMLGSAMLANYAINYRGIMNFYEYLIQQINTGDRLNSYTATMQRTIINLLNLDNSAQELFDKLEESKPAPGENMIIQDQVANQNILAKAQTKAKTSARNLRANRIMKHIPSNQDIINYVSENEQRLGNHYSNFEVISAVFNLIERNHRVFNASLHKIVDTDINSQLNKAICECDGKPKKKST